MPDRYHVVIITSAQKELRKLPTDHLRKIIPEIESLATEPRPRNCKKLKGSKSIYRIRVGDYRIIYDLNDHVRIVEVRAVRSRKDAYD